jgi:uncharacterized membrane protein YfcA
MESNKKMPIWFWVSSVILVLAGFFVVKTTEAGVLPVLFVMWCVYAPIYLLFIQNKIEKPSES